MAHAPVRIDDPRGRRARHPGPGPGGLGPGRAGVGAGAGDFDDNILGYVTPFERRGESAAAVYGYEPSSGTPPATESEASLLYIVHTADRPALFVVHDATSDDSGGGASMAFVASGRQEGGLNVLVQDDPDQDVDVYDRNPIGRVNTRHGWRACCTDGVVLGAAPQFGNGDSIRVSFTDLRNLARWKVIDADGADIDLALDLNRRVELRDFGLDTTVVKVLDDQREGEQCLDEALEEAGAPPKVEGEIDKENEVKEDDRKTYEAGVKSYTEHVKSTSKLEDGDKLRKTFEQTKDTRKEVLDSEPTKPTIKQIASLDKAMLAEDPKVQAALAKIVEANLEVVRNNAVIVNTEAGRIVELALTTQQRQGLPAGRQKQLAKVQQLRKNADSALADTTAELKQILADLDMLGSTGVGKDACAPDGGGESVAVDRFTALNEKLAAINKTLMLITQETKSLAAQLNKYF